MWFMTSVSSPSSASVQGSETSVTPERTAIVVRDMIPEVMRDDRFAWELGVE